MLLKGYSVLLDGQPTDEVRIVVQHISSFGPVPDQREICKVHVTSDGSVKYVKMSFSQLEIVIDTYWNQRRPT